MSRLRGPSGLKKKPLSTVVCALPIIPCRALGERRINLVLRMSNDVIKIVPVDAIQFVGEDEPFNLTLAIDPAATGYGYDKYGNIKALPAPDPVMVAFIPKRMLLGIRRESIYGYSCGPDCPEGCCS